MRVIAGTAFTLLFGPPAAKLGNVRNLPTPNPMIPAFQSLHYLKVLAVSLIGFVIGGLWYSPLLFVKAWLKEMKLTPEVIAARGEGRHFEMPAAFFFTIVSTLALATIIAAHNPPSALKGAELGAFIGMGIIAARSAVNGIFEGRTLRHYMISTGHEVVLFIVQGAILAVWR
jgi:hypothetical protein